MGNVLVRRVAEAAGMRPWQLINLAVREYAERQGILEPAERRGILAPAERQGILEPAERQGIPVLKPPPKVDCRKHLGMGCEEYDMTVGR